MATPRPPPPRLSPQDSPAPPPPPKVNGTSYVWADTAANTSAAPGSARMTTPQLPVDATQGGIVPGAAHGVRLSFQPDQQPMNSGRGQAASLPVVTADSLPPAWVTQKATQAQLPGTYEAAELPAGVQYQYPEAPKKPGKRKKGKKGVEDDGGGMIIPPEHPAAILGSGAFSFGGAPDGGISSTGGVIPPPSPRLGGGSGLGNAWGQDPKPRSTKSGTATPWSAYHSGASVPPIEIEIVPDSPERGFIPRMEGWQTGRSLSHPLPPGNPWTEKIGPSPLPGASPGRPKAAGGFGSGGWGEPTTSASGNGGGISSFGGVVPASTAPAEKKKKKKREGGGGWGGS